MTRDQLETIVYKILEDITGQNSGELMEYSDINIFESGILDSLSLGGFFVQFQEKANRKLSFSDFKLEDFESINTLINAILEILNKK